MTNSRSLPHPRQPVTIGVAVAESIEAAVETAVLLVGGAGWATDVVGPILVLVGNGRDEGLPDSPAAALAGLLRVAAPGRRVAIVRPPTGFGVFRASPPTLRRQGATMPVTEDPPDHTALPPAIAVAGALCLILPLPDPIARAPLAIGTLARHVHPRRALAARLGAGGGRAGLAADIAAPVRPRFIAISTDLGGLPLVAATTDRIAAELIGRALQPERGGGGDPVGPWQDPVVQRATELDLGVRLPNDLVLRHAWTGADHSPAIEALGTLMDRIALRLGVLPLAGNSAPG